jgi:hypothetical protein
VVLHSLTVGVPAVGVVGAAVVVVAVVQWSNLEFEVWGGATHTILCISQSRFGPTIGTEASGFWRRAPSAYKARSEKGKV